MWTSCPLSQQRLCCCCCCCCCPCHGPLSAGPLKHLFMCERDSCPQRWQTVYSISEPVSQSHCQTGDKNTDRHTDSQPQHASLLAAVLGTCLKQVQILYIYIIYMCVCIKNKTDRQHRSRRQICGKQGDRSSFNWIIIQPLQSKLKLMRKNRGRPSDRIDGATSLRLMKLQHQ